MGWLSESEKRLMRALVRESRELRIEAKALIQDSKDLRNKSEASHNRCSVLFNNFFPPRVFGSEMMVNCSSAVFCLQPICPQHRLLTVAFAKGPGNAAMRMHGPYYFVREPS